MKFLYILGAVVILATPLLGINTKLGSIKAHLHRLANIRYQNVYGDMAESVQARVNRKLKGYCRAHSYSEEEYKAIRNCIFDMGYLHELIDSGITDKLYYDYIQEGNDG